MEANHTTPKYLTEKEVSKITGMALQTLRNWRFCSVGIPYTKLHRAVRYSFSDVIKYMEDRKVIPRDAACNNPAGRLNGHWRPQP